VNSVLQTQYVKQSGLVPFWCGAGVATSTRNYWKPFKYL